MVSRAYEENKNQKDTKTLQKGKNSRGEYTYEKCAKSQTTMDQQKILNDNEITFVHHHIAEI